MKPVQTSTKLWILVIFFYLTPLLASLILILQTGHLLGDFIATEIQVNFWELLWISLLYIFPLIIIIWTIHLTNENEKRTLTNNFSTYLFYILLITTVLLVCFGTIPVGSPSATGLLGIVQTVIAKFNPYLLLLLLASFYATAWRIFIGSICVLILGLEHRSLLGYLIAVMAWSIYWIDRKSPTISQLGVFTLLLIVFIFTMQPLLAYVYEIRNQSRGSNEVIAADLVLNYAVGRINSISALHLIWYGDCCSSAPDVYYGIATFLQRLTGLSFFDSINPTQVFNRHLLGGDSFDYATFTGVAGAVVILARASIVALLFNVFLLIIFIRIIYWLTPLPSGASKLPLFLIILYLPYLSGDVWELSLLFQSLVVIRIVYWLYVVMVKGAKPRKCEFKNSSKSRIFSLKY